MSRVTGLVGLVAIAFLAGCASPGAPIAAGNDDVIAGAPIIDLLGAAESHALDADRDFPLDGAPAEATHLRVTVHCTTPGTTAFGTDAGGNNASLVCTERDIETTADTAWLDVPLGREDALFVTLSDGATSTVTLQYARHTPTEWGVNADGETFGVSGLGGEDPDLVAAIGMAPDGTTVPGYVRSADLMGPVPSSPEEALEQQANQPVSRDLPLYESDGRTVIGTFRAG